MAHVEKSIEVDVPIRTAYNQWTQFEEFPHFMEGVESVRQLDDTRMRWKANITGKTELWDATVTEQTPDQIVAWKSTSGAENTGAVSFSPIAADKTQVTVRIGFEPEGIVETVGDKLGFVSRRVEGDLKRFKQYIERRGSETGAWRGEVHEGRVEGSSSGA